MSLLLDAVGKTDSPITVMCCFLASKYIRHSMDCTKTLQQLVETAHVLPTSPSRDSWQLVPTWLSSPHLRHSEPLRCLFVAELLLFWCCARDWRILLLALVSSPAVHANFHQVCSGFLCSTVFLMLYSLISLFVDYVLFETAVFSALSNGFEAASGMLYSSICLLVFFYPSLQRRPTLVAFLITSPFKPS